MTKSDLIDLSALAMQSGVTVKRLDASPDAEISQRTFNRTHDDYAHSVYLAETGRDHFGHDASDYSAMRKSR